MKFEEVSFEKIQDMLQVKGGLQSSVGSCFWGCPVGSNGTGGTCTWGCM